MSRPQLNIKFDREGEKELLEAVKARAQDERISLKEFVLDALKNRLTVPLLVQSTQAKPTISKVEVDELKRRIAKGLPKNKLFQEKQETGFFKNDNHFKGGEKGLPRATPFLPLIYA
jgi:hypothetical protein